MSTPGHDHSDRTPLTRHRPSIQATVKARVKRQATSSFLGTAGAEEHPPVRLAEPEVCLEDAEDHRILLNVGGVRHETHVSTLRNIPNSRLSRLAEIHWENGGGRQEYFFDRHPSVFNSIIDFYRTGEFMCVCVCVCVCMCVLERERYTLGERRGQAGVFL